MVDFCKLFAKKDSAACCEQLRHLKSTLPDEAAAWEETLIALTSAVEVAFSPGLLLTVLYELPFNVCKAFYNRLVTSLELSADCISILAQFVIAKKELGSEQASELIRILLLSPFPVAPTDLNPLVTRIHPQKLSAILLDLHRQSGNFIRHQPEKSEKNLHLNAAPSACQLKYEALLTALCIHASSSDFKLPVLVNGHSFLANLIIMHRIHHAENEMQWQNIIEDLLHQGQHYDWQDRAFKRTVLPCLAKVLAGVKVEKAAEFFVQYAELKQNRSPTLTDKIRLLEDCYQRVGSIELVSKCTQALGSDGSFLVNFLTYNSLNDSHLNIKLLEALPLEDLPRFVGHMLALSSMSIQEHVRSLLFENFISVFCQRLKKASHPYRDLLALATAAASLPEPAVEQLLKAIGEQLSDELVLYSQWLQAVLATFPQVKNLLPYCSAFLCRHGKNSELLLPLLKGMSSENLLSLYVLMVQEKAPPAAYSIFKRLFSSLDRQPQLFFLLVNAPTIHQQLLNDLIQQLDDRNLLTLIEALLSKSKKDSEFKNTLDQVLLAFCRRLPLAKEAGADIHQWVEQPFAVQLAQNILENPDCVYELSLTSSVLWSWISWSSTSSALALRIDRVLNTSLVNESDMKYMALNWLSHFRQSPEQLLLIFNHLEQTQSNRNEIGRENYDSLKKCCWQILRKEEAYQAGDFRGLMKQLKDIKTYDPVLCQLATQDCLQNNPAQGARLLALTESPLPLAIANDILLALLIHSVHEESISNWEKVKTLLAKRSAADNLSFAGQLIDAVEKIHFNPLLARQTYELISDSLHFETVFVHLSTHQREWLISHTPPDHLSRFFSHWFDVLIQQCDKDSLNLGRLLNLLPHDHELIEQILSKEIFQSPQGMAALFAQLASEEGSTGLLVHLHQKISAVDLQWKKQFLIHLQEMLQPQTANAMAAHVLNGLLLLMLEQMSPRKKEDVELILAQLQRLGSGENTEQQEEFRQLALSLLSRFCQQDVHWAKALLNSEAFTAMSINWMKAIDFKHSPHLIPQHPLTQLLLDNVTGPFQKRLKDNSDFQHFLMQLLNDPPASMDIDQYLMLSEHLPNKQKALLARTLSAQPHRSPVQAAALTVLASYLTLRDLYLIFCESENDPIILEAIFAHAEGLSEFKEKERFQLIAAIKSGEQMLKMLDRHSTVERRAAFVEEIFAACGHEEQGLSEKLACWGMNQLSLAALANFTLGEKNKSILNRIIGKKPYYRSFIETYTAQPALDMRLNRGSCLYDFVAQSLTHPVAGHFSSPDFLSELPSKLKIEALESQFQLAHDWQALGVTFKPLANCEQVPMEGLVAARWHHQLQLYNTLLYLFNHYLQVAPSLQEVIQTTALWQQAAFPVRFDMNTASQLQRWLEDYVAKLKDIMPGHCQLVSHALVRYQQKLAVIENNTSYRLYSLFAPDGPKTLAQLSEYQQFMVDAHAHYFQREGSPVNEQLHQMLFVLLADQELSKDERFFRLMFDRILRSPLSAAIDENRLRAYLQSLPVDQTYKAICSFQQKGTFFQRGLSLMALLRKCTSMRQVLEALLRFNTESLEALSQIAQALNLVHLTEVLRLTVHIKTLSTSSRWAPEKLLPQMEDNELSIDWLQEDLDKIDSCSSFFDEQCKRLARLAFSYNDDNANRQRLLCLLQGFPQHFSPQLLVHCLNTYGTLFVDKKSHAPDFLGILSQLLRKEEARHMVSQLHSDLIAHIVDEALKEPEKHQILWQQLIHSSYRTFCQRKLVEQLSRLCRDNQIDVISSVEQLSAIAALKGDDAQAGVRILAIWRLLSIIHPQEDADLLMQMDFANDFPEKKQAIIADAVLFRQLQKLKKECSMTAQNVHVFSKAVQWLKEQSGDYLLMLDIHLLMKSQKLPSLLQYYGLIWRAELSGQPPQVLLDGFLNWLSQLNDFSAEHTCGLKRMLQYIADEDLLKPLCEGVEQMYQLKPEQRRWLCQHLPFVDAFNADYLSDLINIGAQCGLWQITFANQEEAFALVRQGLSHPDYARKLMHDEDEQEAFLQRLAKENFPFQDILQLLEEVTERKFRSLLLLHLAGREDYLKALGGQAFTEALSPAEYRRPRLQVLLLQIEPCHLTPAAISRLTPEAAASLLCSVRYFHVWDKERLGALIRLYPRSEFIKYWLMHFSFKPNATWMLSYFIEFADTHFYPYLEELDASSKRELVSHIIRNFSLFSLLSHRRFLQNCEERHLYEAIQWYVNGQSSEELKNFINQLYYHFKKQQHAFSREAFSWLLTLSAEQEFDPLNKEVAYLLNQHIRLAALAAKSDLFYDADVFNLSRAQTLISLQTEEPAKKISLLLQQAIDPASMGKAKGSKTINDPEENSLMEDIRREKAPLKAIDYYLMHSQDRGALPFKLMEDYLNCFEYRGMDLSSLHSTCSLMQKETLDESVRSMIFNRFLEHPCLHDAQTFVILAKVDVEATVKSYGREKRYTSLIEKGRQALEQDLPYEVAKILDKATQEAEFELQLAEMQGPFKRLRTWFKRCCFYGWHGFFIPNRPQFVIPFDEAGVQSLHKAVPAHRNPLLSAEEKLQAALQSGFYLNVHEALSFYNMSPVNEDNEMALRKEADACFERLLRQRRNDHRLNQWLDKNDAVFLANRKRLLEQFLRSGKREETIKYLTCFAQGPGDFASVLAEFEAEKLPEMLAEVKKSAKKINIVGSVAFAAKETKETVVTVASHVASNVASFFSGSDSKAMEVSKQVKPKSGWLNWVPWG